MTVVKALFLKDLRLFLADRRAVLIAFLVPLVLAGFFGAVFGGTGKAGAPAKIALLVADEDGSEVTRGIVASLASGTLVKPVAKNVDEARRLVSGGGAPAFVRFPRGFGAAAGAAFAGGSPPGIEMGYDPAKATEAQVAQGAIQEAASKAVAQASFGGITGGSLPKPFALSFAPLAGKGGRPDSSGPAHAFAGMALQGILFFAINSAMTMLRDRRLGIWRRLRAAPVGLGELLVAKWLSMAAISGVILAAVLLFGTVVFSVRPAGSLIGLGLVAVLASGMVSAFGLLVASLGRTEEQSRGLSTLAVLAMLMLGGAWIPSFLLPAWFQPLSYLVPVRWALDGFDAALWRGGGLAAVLVPAAGLLLFTLAFGAVAATRFRRLSAAE